MARGKWEFDECICGEVYRNFRAEGQPTFQAAVNEAIRRSVQRKAEGDYSLQGRRTTGLMVMHEHKLAEWKRHKHECDEIAAYKEMMT